MTSGVTDIGSACQTDKAMEPSDESSLLDLRHELLKVRFKELSDKSAYSGAGNMETYEALVSRQWLRLDEEYEKCLPVFDPSHNDYWSSLKKALDTGYSNGPADPDFTVAAFGEVTGKILSFLSYHMYVISIRVLSGDRNLLVRYGELILEVLTGLRLDERPSSLLEDLKSSYLDYLAEDVSGICSLAESYGQNLRELTRRIYDPSLQSTYDHTEDSGLFLTRDYAGRFQQLVDQGSVNTDILRGFANVHLNRDEEKTGAFAGLHYKASAVYLDDRQMNILDHSTDLCNLLRTGLL